MSSENLLQLLPQGLLWDFVRRKKLGHRGHTSVQKNKKKYCNRYLSLGTALTKTVFGLIFITVEYQCSVQCDVGRDFGQDC